MARRGGAQTLGIDVYERLRHEVLTGRLRPGERLKPTALKDRFDVSVGVVREALTRLSEQKLVATEHNQGYRVATLSRQGFSDLTLVRVTVEGLALRLATDRGDLLWESELIAAHHRMTHTPRRAPGAPDEMTDAWAEAHRAFHLKLIDACAVPILIETCAELSDAAELYRRWSAPAGRHRDVAGEHQRLVDAVLARDSDGAVAALRDHYEMTLEIVLSTGLLTERSPDWSDGAEPADAPGN